MACVRASQDQNDNGNQCCRSPVALGEHRDEVCMPQQAQSLCALKLPSITAAGLRTLQGHYLLAGVQADTGVGKQGQGCGDEWGNAQYPLQIVE